MLGRPGKRPAPSLSFRAHPVGPGPTARVSSRRGRGSASSLARPGGFPAWQPGEPRGPAGTAGSDQRGGLARRLGGWRSRPGVKGRGGWSSPRATYEVPAPAPTHQGRPHPPPGSLSLRVQSAVGNDRERAHLSVRKEATLMGPQWT